MKRRSAQPPSTQHARQGKRVPSRAPSSGPERGSRPAERTTQAVWALPAVVAVAVLVHLNVLANGFALDDVGIIVNNPRIHDLTNLPAIWLAPYWPYLGVELGLWRPLSSFMYALQWAAGGGSPVLFHLVSIALHAAVTGVGFRFLERFAGTPGALAGALLFAVHPVHTEAVANVVGQAELLAALAVLVACRLHAERSAEAGGSGRHAAQLGILFAAGLLAKEHAVVLPALLVLTDAVNGRLGAGVPGLTGYARRMGRPATVFGLVLIGYLAVRMAVLQGNLFGVDAGPQVGYLRGEHRVLVALQAFPEYMRLLFFPATLASDYAPGMFTPATGIAPDVVAGALILAGLLALACMLPVRPRIAFPAAWFVIAILPASNLLFPTGVFVAERTLYLPSFALAAAAALAVTHWLPKAGRTAVRVAMAALVLVTILGGMRTWVRNPDWRSTDSIMDSLVRDHPGSYVAQLRLAGLAVERGAPEAARQHYEAALRIYADDSELLNEYGNFLLARGEAAAAVPLFERSYALHPFVSRTAVFLGTAYLEAGRFDDVLRIAEEARSRGFAPAVHVPLAAAALDGLGRVEEALAAWQEVISQVQLSPPVQWAMLARTIAVRNEPEAALQAVDRGRSAAGRDLGTVQLMDAVERAVRDGCYAGTARTECDPVAAWQRSLPATYGTWASPLDRP